jgi:type II secretory pathway pseudopilin PulG
MNTDRRKSEGGFTLVETIVVVGIILIVLGMSAGLFGLFSKDRALQGSASIVRVMFQKVRGLAAKSQRVHFIVVSATGDSIEIWEDTNADGRFSTGDQKAAEEPVQLRGGTFISKFPTDAWSNKYIGFRPGGGSLVFPAGTTDIDAATFETAINSGSPVGDIEIASANATIHAYVDVVGQTGLIRKVHLRAD